jgi:predicted kinase
MPRLILIRGLPGAGKTTAAQKFLQDGFNRYSADDYFVGEDGIYRFDGSKIANAHNQCYSNTVKSLMNGESVIVDNTFTQRWEMQRYMTIGSDHGINVDLEVIDLFDGGFSDHQLSLRNVHSVPEKNISMMRRRYEYDWENGNPLAPWERNK